MSSENTVVENRWNDRDAEGLSDIDLLVYQSRLVGSDPAMVLWGGGNTSIKTRETDFRGRGIEVTNLPTRCESLVARPGKRVQKMMELHRLLQPPQHFEC